MTAITTILYYVGEVLYAAGTYIASNALQIAATAASMAIQRAQAKKAAAAARRQQEAAQKAAQRQLAEQAAAAQALRDTIKAPRLVFSDAGGPAALSQTIKRAVVSRRIVYGRARVGGILAGFWTTNDMRVLHMVYLLCDGPIDGVESMYLDEEQLVVGADGWATNKFASYVRAKVHRGIAGDPADPDLVAAVSEWTQDHTLEGIAYVYLRLESNPELFSNVPDFSAIVRGTSDIYDPRSGATGWTQNSALCLAHYMELERKGPGIPRTRIDQEALIHAANVCDERVALLAGGNEMRYATNGAVDLALSPEDILMLLRQPMAGQLVRIDKKYEILAGEYRPPSMTVDESMLSGPVRLTVNPGRRARATVVKGTFVGERTRWQRADFPSVKDTSVDDVSGRESSVDLTLEQVASPAQAQRLARIVLKGARSGRVFSLRCNARAMAARPGATVLFKMPRHAPDGVICEVQDWSFVILADGALGVELELRETSAGVYEWLPEYESQFIDAPELGALIHTVAQPALVPPPGVYGAGQTVAITCATAGAAIRYSLSAIPKDETEGNIYAAPVSVSVGQTLYVRAFKASLKPSAPAYGAYT